MTAHQIYVTNRSLTVYNYDTAEDGPEVGMLSFFHVFPDGNVKGLEHWDNFIRGIECDSRS